MKRPFLWFSIFLSAGIFLSPFFPYVLSLWLCLGALLIISLFFVLRNDVSSSVLIYVLFFFLGIIIFNLKVGLPSMNRIDQYSLTNSKIRFQGKVIGFFQISGKNQALIKAHKIMDNSHILKNISGSVLLKMENEAVDLNMFDWVQVDGTIIQLPFKESRSWSGFDGWMKSQGIDMVVKIEHEGDIEVLSHEKSSFLSFVNRLRSWCADKLSLGIMKESVTYRLLNAMVLGDQAALDPMIKKAFLYTNTIHILSISGLHLSVILFSVLFFLGLFSIRRRWVYGVTLIVIWVYAMMTGMHPPIVRSALMASFYLISAMVMKKADIGNSLGMAAVFMLALNPLWVFDPGFQLSFLCLISLVFLTPKIEADLEFLQVMQRGMHLTFAYKRDRVFAVSVRWLIKMVSASLAVWVGVLPVIAYHFQIFSPITVFANLIAVPLTGFIMNLGFASCLLGFFEGLSHALNKVNEILVSGLVLFMDALSRVGGAYYFIHQPTWIWLIFYDAVILYGLWKAKNRIRYSYFFIPALLLMMLLTGNSKENLKVQWYFKKNVMTQMAEWPDGHSALWIEKGMDSKIRDEDLSWLIQLPQYFKMKTVHALFSDVAMNQFLKTLKVDSLHSLTDDTLRIQYGNVWMIRLKNEFKNDRNFQKLQGSGIIVITESFSESKELIELIDRKNITGVIWMGKDTPEFINNLQARGIWVRQLLENQLISMETDGERVWIVR